MTCTLIIDPFQSRSMTAHSASLVSTQYSSSPLYAQSKYYDGLSPGLVPDVVSVDPLHSNSGDGLSKVLSWLELQDHRCHQF